MNDFMKNLKSGICPYCNKGVFKQVTVHIAHVHGIPAGELRAKAGMFNDEPLCLPATLERKREKAIINGLGTKIRPRKKIN